MDLTRKGFYTLKALKNADSDFIPIYWTLFLMTLTIHQLLKT